jgi:hypothetical protein
MSDNESDMTPVPMEETSPVAAASDLVLCFELVWDSDKIELYNDEEGKQRWQYDSTAVETGLESEMEKGEQGGEGSVGSNSDGN